MRRFATVVLLLLACVLAFAYFFPQPPHLAPFSPPEVLPGRLLIFAPHSDDETLATGGLVQQVEAEGGEPRVILVTGSDAFVPAAEAYYRRVHLSGADMVNFGRHRLGESRAAIDLLGLAPQQLTFLGYPDHALHRLWVECWRETSPCTSPHTQVSSVPYTEARTPGAPYAGRALLRELVELLRHNRPATVAFPYPYDAHVDHWGLANFVIAALEEVRRSDPTWIPPREWLYLVHRGDWPAPKGYYPDAALLPPEPLVTDMTAWLSLPLTADQVKKKELAVEAYRTQMAILRRFMHSFVRSNELVGQIDRISLDRPPENSTPGTPPWTGVTWVKATIDPHGDTLARRIERDTDIVHVWAAKRGNDLAVAAEVAAPIGNLPEMRILVRGFRTGAGWGDLNQVRLRARGKTAGPPSANVHVKGTWAVATLPLTALGAPQSVMVAVETWIGGMLIDRTAWRLLSVDGR